MSGEKKLNPLGLPDISDEKIAAGWRRLADNNRGAILGALKALQMPPYAPFGSRPGDIDVTDASGQKEELVIQGPLGKHLQIFVKPGCGLGSK